LPSSEGWLILASPVGVVNSGGPKIPRGILIAKPMDGDWRTLNRAVEARHIASRL